MPRLILLLVALLLPTVQAWLYFVVLAVGKDPNPVQQVVYLLGKVVQFSLPLLDWALWDRQRPSRRLFSSAGVGIGLTFGLAVALGMLALYFFALRGSPLLADTAEEVRLKVAQLGVGTPLAFLGLALFLSLAHSLLEEYYWRWYAYGRLREWLPIGWANFLAGLAFASHHLIVLAVFSPGRFWTKAVPLGACIVVGGMFWAWLYQRSGSVLGPWLSHALIDSAIFVIGWDLIASP
jgi:membrane protease YdiL (CAAX protease family)